MPQRAMLTAIPFLALAALTLGCDSSPESDPTDGGDLQDGATADGGDNDPTIDPADVDPADIDPADIDPADMADAPVEDAVADPVEPPPECVGITCSNGGSCVVVESVGVCDCPAGTSGRTCGTLCDAEILTPTACTFENGDCLSLFNGVTPAGLSGTCAQGVPCEYDEGSCNQGCVRFALDIDLGAASWVPEIWWRADWWQKRPARVSIFSSDSSTFATSRLVAEITGQGPPWQCVDGEACTEEVPDECCPDGRSEPQRIDEGALLPLWDIARFEGDQARYWRFAIDETYDPDDIVLLHLRFYGHDCPAGLGCDPRVEECGEDLPDPPEVVSTDPADGATVRFDSAAAFPGEINRLTVTFDRNVFETGTESQPLTMIADHLESDFSQALEVRPRTGGDDQRVLTLDSAGVAYTAFPGGEYEVTLENVRSHELGVLDSYSWRFDTLTCGDDTCDFDESECTCQEDCGSCAGCCAFDFNDGDVPKSTCRPGTANNECGINGNSCGVCEAPDVCTAGGCD